MKMFLQNVCRTQLILMKLNPAFMVNRFIFYGEINCFKDLLYQNDKTGILGCIPAFFQFTN